MIDPHRFGNLPPPSLARTAGVARIASGLGRQWVPVTIEIGGRLYAGVHLAEPDALPFVDYGVPWICPEAALAAAINLPAMMADA
jgi:hypothetical protein